MLFVILNLSLPLSLLFNIKGLIIFSPPSTLSSLSSLGLGLGLILILGYFRLIRFDFWLYFGLISIVVTSFGSAGWTGFVFGYRWCWVAAGSVRVNKRERENLMRVER